MRVHPHPHPHQLAGEHASLSEGQDVQDGSLEGKGDGSGEPKMQSEMHVCEIKGNGVYPGNKPPSSCEKLAIKWEGEFLEDPMTFDDQPWANLEVFRFWDKVRGVVCLTSFINLAVSTHLVEYDYQKGPEINGSMGEEGITLTAWFGFVVHAAQYVEAVALCLMLFSLRKEKTKWNMGYRFFSWIYSKIHNGQPPFIPIDSSFCLR